MSWNVEKREQVSCMKGHSDIVTSLIALNKLNNIVSGSLDCNINVFDPFTERLTATLKGHTKGVNSLAFNSDHRLLISCGYDRKLNVWSMGSPTVLSTLRGHRGTLVGCQTLDGTSELISADSDGMIKLWDLRTLKCVQTFTSEHKHGDVNDLRGVLSSFVHTRLPNPLDESENFSYIIVGSRKLIFFGQ